MSVRELFLEDLSKVLDYWSMQGTKCLTDDLDPKWIEDLKGREAIRTAFADAGVTPDVVQSVLNELLRGFAVSVLSIVDGATELAEHSRLALVAENGTSLGDGLHDAFVSHLLQTGRMK